MNNNLECPFKIKITKYKYSTFDDGSEGTIVYFNISNVSQKSIMLNFKLFCLIVDGVQKYYDCWLTGYLINNTQLFPSCSSNGAVIFNNSKIKENSKALFIIEVLYENILYGYFFELLNGKFKLKDMISEEIKQMEDLQEREDNNELIAKELENKLLQGLETIDSFEEKYGVSLENIYIQIPKDLHEIIITGELLQNNRDKDFHNYWVNITFYNFEGKIITTRREDFYGFEDYDTFEVEIFDEDLVKKVDRIRIYVKGK